MNSTTIADALRQALTDNPGGVSITDLMHLTGASRPTVRKTLNRLQTERVVMYRIEEAA